MKQNCQNYERKINLNLEVTDTGKLTFRNENKLKVLKNPVT